MLLRKMAMLCVAGISLSCCGSYTPNIHEFWGTSQNATAMEAAVAAQISCELGNAINSFHKPNTARLASEDGFLFHWLAQVTLTFTVDEQSTLNPTPSFVKKLHPLSKGETFTLGLSGTYKNQATRTDMVILTYRVKNFIGAKRLPCNAGKPHKGTLFVQSEDPRLVGRFPECGRQPGRAERGRSTSAVRCQAGRDLPRSEVSIVSSGASPRFGSLWSSAPGIIPWFSVSVIAPSSC